MKSSSIEGTLITNPQENSHDDIPVYDYDTDFFQRIVADAGRWAYGVVFVEVWVMNEDRTQLERPPGGYWVDPVARDYGQGKNSKFQRLIDPTREDYFPPTPQAPGVGIPGALWSQAARGNVAAESSSIRNSTIFGGGNTSRQGHSWNGALFPFETVIGGTNFGGRATEKKIKDDLEVGVSRWKKSWRRGGLDTNLSDAHQTGAGSFQPRHDLLPSEIRWRRISELANDPDQPFNPRIQYLEFECDLGYAAGVPFLIGPTEGIVIYMARKAVNIEKLTNFVNEEYLTHSALLIGSAYALRRPRLAAEQERRLESQQTMQRVRLRMKELNSLNRNIDSFVAEESMRKRKQTTLEVNENDTLGNDTHGQIFCPWIGKAIHLAVVKLRSCYRKFFGAQIAPPPPFTWEQTAFSLFGSLITLSVMVSIDFFLVTNYGSDFEIVWGPVGALMTLIFSLTSAPASQPRNILLGQTLCLFIGYGFGRTAMDGRIKACLSTSISVALMARLGITHPPAGSSALILSSGTYSLTQIGITLMANAIAIFLGALCNNVSDKRQYPTSWHITSTFSSVNGVTLKTPREPSTTISMERNSRNFSGNMKRSPNMLASYAVNTIVEPDLDHQIRLAHEQLRPSQRPSDGLSEQRQRPVFRLIASAFSTDAVAMESLRRKETLESRGDEPGSLTQKNRRKSEETIDLTTVLAQARNPFFLVEDETSVPNQFVNGTSDSRFEGSLFPPVVVDDPSIGNRTIELSEVIEAAKASHASLCGSHSDATNHSNVGLERLCSDDKQGPPRNEIRVENDVTCESVEVDKPFTPSAMMNETNDIITRETLSDDNDPIVIHA